MARARRTKATEAVTASGVPAGLTVRRVALDELVLDDHNARVHGDRNRLAIRASLEAHGQVEPLVVQARTRKVIGGNGRLVEMRGLGWTHGDVVELDVDDATARRLGVTLNRTAELAEWDRETLAELLVDVTADAEWTADELSILLGHGVGRVPSNNLDGVDPAGPADTKNGETYVLCGGACTVVCGDATDRDTVVRVIAEREAAVLVTSPPYWTGQPYDDAPGVAGIRSFAERTAAAWCDRVRRRVVVQTGHTRANLCGEDGSSRRVLLDAVWADAWYAHGWSLRHRRCWAKSGPLPHPRPISDMVDESWEQILTFDRIGHNEGGQERCGSWALAGVWDDIPGVSEDGHPCPFPVEIPRRHALLYAARGDLVVDPFAGSGTTAIAALAEGRRVLLCERIAAYVDVIRARVTQWALSAGVDPGPGRL